MSIAIKGLTFLMTYIIIKTTLLPEAAAHDRQHTD